MDLQALRRRLEEAANREEAYKLFEGLSRRELAELARMEGFTTEAWTYRKEDLRKIVLSATSWRREHRKLRGF